MPPTEPEFVNLAEAARMVGVAEASTIKYWINRGWLQGERLRSQWRIRREDVLKVAAARKLAKKPA